MDTTHLGYTGAQRASDHADREVTAMDAPLWSKCAWVRFLEYLLSIGPGARFTTEDFRDFAYTHALADPPDPRAFGNVTRLAVQKKLIRFVGYVKAQNPQCHGRDVKEWEVV